MMMKMKSNIGQDGLRNQSTACTSPEFVLILKNISTNNTVTFGNNQPVSVIGAIV